MVVISLKDYAAQKNVTYEAVRQQVNRYKDELDGHIIRDGRQQFLDEDAVAFLDAKREKNPVTILQQSKDETIGDLERTKEQLLIKVADQADKIAALAKWKADHAVAIAQMEQTQRLLDTTKEELEQERRERINAAVEAKQQIEEYQEKINSLQNELEQERGKSFWQRLFGK